MRHHQKDQYIHLEVPKGKAREKRAERISKQIIIENFPSLIKDIIYTFNKFNELQVG